jgi:hypothetical protein
MSREFMFIPKNEDTKDKGSKYKRDYENIRDMKTME